jgi:hypothetical protein
MFTRVRRATLLPMPTPRNFLYEFPLKVEDMAALLRDPAFLRWRCEVAGDKNVEVSVEEGPAGHRVKVARDREVSLPAFAKKMFQSKNRIVDETVWKQDGERWVAQYEISIPGIPGEVRGRTSIVPSADGCRYESNFEVTSKVPLVGGKLESFVADRVEETLRANAERSTQYAPS